MVTLFDHITSKHGLSLVCAHDNGTDLQQSVADVPKPFLTERGT